MPKKSLRRPKHASQRRPLLAALAFGLIFAAIGSYFLFTSHAATTSDQLEIALDRSLCMDNEGDTSNSKEPIVLYGCSSSDAGQQWSVESVSGGFLIEDAAGTCVDDTGDGVGTNASNRVYLQTYACNSSDHAQIWQWSGSAPSQLQNVYSGGCINDPANNEDSGTQLIVYVCSPASSNAEWYEVAVTPPPAPSVSITSPTTSSVSGSVLVSAKASVSSGSISSLTVKIGGTTMGSCSNADTCYFSWGTTSYGNGSYTIQATATTAVGKSAQASETVTVDNASSSSGSSGGSSGSGGTSGSSPPSSPSSGGSSGSSSGSISDNPGSGSDLDGSVDFDDSGSSDDLITVGSPTGDDTGDQSLSVDQTTSSDTLTTNTSTTSGPTVANIVPTKITSTFITLMWGGTDATSYLIRYGLSSNHLTASHTLKSAALDPIYTLTGLTAGTHIYISITPKNGSTSGAAQDVNFVTLKRSNPIGPIIFWIFFLAIIGVAIVMLRRKLNTSPDSSTPMVDIEHASVYPQEDEATQAARVNWWLSDDQRQAIAQRQAAPAHHQEDDYPDMFDEGRKRLDDERQNQYVQVPSEPPMPVLTPAPEPAEPPVPPRQKPHPAEPHHDTDDNNGTEVHIKH